MANCPETANRTAGLAPELAITVDHWSRSKKAGITPSRIAFGISSQRAEGVGIGRTRAVKSRHRQKSRLFVAVAAAVERGPISK